MRLDQQRSRVAVLVVMLALSLGVGGCSSGDDEPWAASGTDHSEADEDTYAFVAALVSDQPTAESIERLGDAEFVRRAAETVGRITDTQIVIGKNFSEERRFEVHHDDETICGQLMSGAGEPLAYVATPCERPQPGDGGG